MLIDEVGGRSNMHAFMIWASFLIGVHMFVFFMAEHGVLRVVLARCDMMILRSSL